MKLYYIRIWNANYLFFEFKRVFPFLRIYVEKQEMKLIEAQPEGPAWVFNFDKDKLISSTGEELALHKEFWECFKSDIFKDPAIEFYEGLHFEIGYANQLGERLNESQVKFCKENNDLAWATRCAFLSDFAV